MPLMVVATTKFSEEFDQNFLGWIAQIGPEVALEHTISEEGLKTYYIGLSDHLVEMNVISFLKEFFKFDRDILGITFLRRWENLYERDSGIDGDSADGSAEELGDNDGTGSE